MELIARKMSFDEGAKETLDYWAGLPVRERFLELRNWNRKVWKFLGNEDYIKMDKTTGFKKLKCEADEDDF